MSLKEKILKNTTLSYTSTLTDSKIYTTKDVVPTNIPMVNVLLSGLIDGGITPGTTMFAGPSKHFKTGFALLLASAFLHKYPDGLILFYDSEFGTPQSYFTSFGIPFGSVIHTPVTDLDELKHDIVVQLTNLDRGERVMIIIDSIGNLASRKEIEDALEGSNKADFTRAKAIKSIFRIITPKLTLKDIPLIAINHTYKTLELYSKDQVGGGTGSYYGSDNIWILGRQQDKDKDKELTGYNFIINVEKSRFVKEKSKVPILISFEKGINRWSGLLDVAVDGGFIGKPKKGYFSKIERTTGEFIEPFYKEDEIIDNAEFWESMLADEYFVDFIEDKYALGQKIVEEESSANT